MARIGLVTVTYNSAIVLPDFLESVRQCCKRSAHEITLYAVDNASGDSSVSQLRSATGASSVVLLPQPSNRGVACGNNVGIRRALADDCDYVILINNDTYFDGSLMDDLVAASEAHGSSPVVPLILATAPPGTIWFAGGQVHQRRAFKVISYNLGELPPASMPAGPTPYAPSCCLLLPAAILHTVGLMDESFFVYGDDVDFAHRVRVAGWTPVFWPQSVLHHKASSLTGGSRSEFGVVHETHARVLLTRKYLKGHVRAFAAVYLLIYALARLAVRRDPVKVCLLRLRSCFSGYRLPLLSAPVAPPRVSVSTR